MKRGLFLATLPMLVWLFIGVAQVLIGPDMRSAETRVNSHYQTSSEEKLNFNWSYTGEAHPDAGKQITLQPVRYLEQPDAQGGSESNRINNDPRQSPPTEPEA